MKIDEAIKHAIDENAILFLGAGFSIEATNLLGKNMKIASEMSHFLCDEMKTSPNDNLSLVSDMYLENNNDPQKLVDLLSYNYTCKGYEPYHKVIAELPWKRIYTTNYDNVFEKSSNESGINRKALMLSDDPKNYNKKDIVLHINGYICDLHKEMLNNQFKLTSTSYLVEEFTKRPWLGLFLSDIQNHRAIIFIGASFTYDIDLQRIFHGIPECRDKIIFIDKILSDDEKNDPFYNFYKHKFGEVYNIGVSSFASEITKIKSVYKPKTQIVKFDCFSYINKNGYLYKDVKTQDIWDLLVFGKIKSELVFHNIKNNKYIFEREISKIIIETVLQKDCRVIVIHSDLGTGKTCIINSISEILKNNGEVFVLQKNMEYITEEIQKISEISGMKFIIIENYNYYFDVLKKLKPFLDENYRIILTARTYIHESVSYKVGSLLDMDNDSIFEFQVNFLEGKDIDNAVSLLGRTELQNSYRGLKPEVKRRYIEKDYNRSFREILLDLVKSERISTKIDELYKQIEKSTISKKLLLAVFVNSIVNLELNLSDILSLLGTGALPQNVLKDSNLNELVDFDSNKISAKSSIFAKHIISTQKLSCEILEIMKTMINNANKFSYGDKALNIRKSLVSISNLWIVLADKSHYIKDAVLSYYDDLKDYDEYNDNPYFWLQYAIACLDVKEYGRSEKYFEIAYQEAKSKKQKNIQYEFDTFQIDTQFARYLLEYNIYQNTTSEPFEVIEQAHNLLIKTLNKNKGQKHYVFGQVGNYYVFYKKYSKTLTSKEKNSIIRYCKEMNIRIEEYELSKKHQSINKVVIDSKKEISECIKEILKTAII